jgi:hypothetical protein
VLLNTAPVTIWLNGNGPQSTASSSSAGPLPSSESPLRAQVGTEAISSADSPGQADAPVPSFAKPLKATETKTTGARATEIAAPAAPRDTSPEALSSLQGANKEVLATMLKELGPQAHFVSYAAPTFVAFRQGIYLELSTNAALSESTGSRYKLAALAFDEHVARLIRPVLGYFKEEPKFDGIGFSTTLRPPGKSTASNSSEAVEFFFPFTALYCYQHYDCTGQQLIDAGTVLINGERVSLDLQVAEGSSSNR